MTLIGEKRDCTCKKARHEHGTRTAYVVDKCRCDPCREASAATDRTRGARRPPPTKIIAVRPSLEAMAEGRNIDSTGTVRRLQALVAIGWSQSRLGQRIGIAPSNMSTFMRGDQCSAGKARAVRELYNELWNTPQDGTEQRSRISANRARNYAKAQGWLPPLAWDDETIDDPNATPGVFEETPMVHGEERIGDIEFLIRTGAGQTEILSRLGFKNLAALERLCHRYGRGDVVRKMKNLRDLERVA